MMKKRYSDQELMKLLNVDKKTLDSFYLVQSQALAEAKRMAKLKKGKVKVLGISGSARDENDMAQEKSNSEELLSQCLAHCQKLGGETELLSLRDYEIKYCKACYSTTNTQCHFYCSCYPKGKSGDDMTNILYDKILAADVLIFATPVNNFKVSTLMATFLDRCINLDGSLMPADPKNPKNKELNIKQMKFIELTADDNVPGSGLLRRFLGKVGGIIVTGHEAGASMTISSLFLTLNYFGMMFPPFSSVYAMSSICNSTYQDKKIVICECYATEIKLLAENLMTMAKWSRKTPVTEWKYNYGAN